MDKTGQVLEWRSGEGQPWVCGFNAQWSAGWGWLKSTYSNHRFMLATTESHNCLKVACNPIAGIPVAIDPGDSWLRMPDDPSWRCT